MSMLLMMDRTTIMRRTMLMISVATCTFIAGGFSIAAEDGLRFTAAGSAFRFDTGALRGTLRGDGTSAGLTAVFDCMTGTALAKSLGLFSHYRLLDAGARYGTAAWDWTSSAKLLPDGAVEVLWQANADHPFDLKARYCWAASNALDVTTTVTARKELRKFESFLASYFNGFAQSRVFATNDGSSEFIVAQKSDGNWQAFPRDDDAAKIIGDGRWKRPPHPVEWTIRKPMAAPLGMRRDGASGLTALIMARPQDCFGVLTPYGDEEHRSLYLSLFGRDLKSGETVSAMSRLVVGREISDSQAVAMFEEFVREKGNTP